MKQIFITVTFFLLGISVFGQTKMKQSSLYFEFSYRCELLSSNYDSKRDFQSYIYTDSINDIVVIIDVKKKTYLEDGDKEFIDNMVFDYGNIKATTGYFCGIYALITDGKENDGSTFKSVTLYKSKRAYIVTILSSFSESVKKAYKQIEETFVFK